MAAQHHYGTPLYRDGETRVVYSVLEAAIAQADGWSVTPTPVCEAVEPPAPVEPARRPRGRPRTRA